MGLRSADAQRVLYLIIVGTRPMSSFGSVIRLRPADQAMSHKGEYTVKAWSG